MTPNTKWRTGTRQRTRIAPYLHNMIAARPLLDGSRLTLFNGRVTSRGPDGQSRRRNLKSTEDFAAVLRDEFDLAVPDHDLEQMLRVKEERGTRGAPHPFFA